MELVQLYTLSEVAESLKISVRNLKRLLEEKNLPIVLVGKRIRIEYSVIEKLITRVEPVSLEARCITI